MHSLHTALFYVIGVLLVIPSHSPPTTGCAYYVHTARHTNTHRHTRLQQPLQTASIIT